MKEQKNIERLFQEKFKEYEVLPPQNAWNNIEQQLQKKEKKRIIPFWFKTSGVAALLLLGFLSFLYLNNDNQQKVNKSVEKNNEIIQIKNDSNSSIVPNKSTVTGIEAKPIDQKIRTKTLKKESIPLVKNNNQQNLNNIVTNKKYKTEASNQSKYAQKNQVLSQAEINLEINNNLITNKSISVEVVKDSSKVQNQNTNNRFVVSEKIETNKTQDSSIVAQIQEEVSSLEQLLNEKVEGKNADEKEKRDRWGVSTSAAPVYFNSISNGSPITMQFAENTKSYTNTISYGVGLSYELSNKLSLRTGINSLALEYNTNDVLFSTTLKAATQPETALSRNANGDNIVFVTNNTNSLSGDVENFIQENRGVLNQSTSYFEIPLELSYKLIDSKFGLEIIGGMSSLFLNENAVSLMSNGMEMSIGEASNLNKIHFSSNIGIGFKYSFFKSLEANFNPMFKYQLNTYTDSSGNFKPYFIGLYSGISYRF